MGEPVVGGGGGVEPHAFGPHLPVGRFTSSNFRLFQGRFVVPRLLCQLFLGARCLIFDNVFCLITNRWRRAQSSKARASLLPPTPNPPGPVAWPIVAPHPTNTLALDAIGRLASKSHITRRKQKSWLKSARLIFSFICLFVCFVARAQDAHLNFQSSSSVHFYYAPSGISL